MRLYLVLELLGPSLADEVKEKGPFPWPAATRRSTTRLQGSPKRTRRGRCVGT